MMSLLKECLSYLDEHGKGDRSNKEWVMDAATYHHAVSLLVDNAKDNDAPVMVDDLGRPLLFAIPITCGPQGDRCLKLVEKRSTYGQIAAKYFEGALKLKDFPEPPFNQPIDEDKPFGMFILFGATNTHGIRDVQASLCDPDMNWKYGKAKQKGLIE